MSLAMPVGLPRRAPIQIVILLILTTAVIRGYILDVMGNMDNELEGEKIRVLIEKFSYHLNPKLQYL